MPIGSAGVATIAEELLGLDGADLLTGTICRSLFDTGPSGVSIVSKTILLMTLSTCSFSSGDAFLKAFWYPSAFCFKSRNWASTTLTRISTWSAKSQSANLVLLIFFHPQSLTTEFLSLLEAKTPLCATSKRWRASKWTLAIQPMLGAVFQDQARWVGGSIAAKRSIWPVSSTNFWKPFIKSPMPIEGSATNLLWTLAMAASSRGMCEKQSKTWKFQLMIISNVSKYEPPKRGYRKACVAILEVNIFCVRAVMFQKQKDTTKVTSWKVEPLKNVGQVGTFSQISSSHGTWCFEECYLESNATYKNGQTNVCTHAFFKNPSQPVIQPMQDNESILPKTLAKLHSFWYALPSKYVGFPRLFWKQP